MALVCVCDVCAATYIMCATIFMLFLHIYCPYKHEWKVVDEKYYVDEKKNLFLFVLFVVGLTMMQGWVRDECAHSRKISN